MPELIDRNMTWTVPNWFICAATNDEQLLEIMKQLGDREKVSVELRIEGIEVSFCKGVNELYDRINTLVLDKAARLLNERAECLQGSLRKLQELSERVEQEVRREVHKLFPETVTEEDCR